MDSELKKLVQRHGHDPLVQFFSKKRREAIRTIAESEEAMRTYLLNKSKSATELLPSLTAKQAEVLDYIATAYVTEGASPTLAEIAHAMGWCSLNSAVTNINALVKKGYLMKTGGGTWRSIVPVFDSKKNRIKCKS